MSETAQCPECGQPLPKDAVGGLCPQCLLRRAESTTGGTETQADDRVQEGRQAPPIQEIAGLFPELEIVEVLGEGGMGVVYKARQAKLERWVALKILVGPEGQRTRFAERFTREARALAKLNHPGIVGVFDLGQAGDYSYLLMEFVEGTTLRSVIDAKSLQPGEALSVVMQICEALQYAHEEGVVHRDIKPGNILIDKRGRVKIADFGLAKLLGTTGVDVALTATRHVMGTPHYMAPEQIEHPQEVDHRADIYSLGVVFYEMLTGDLPLGRFAPPSKKVQIDVRLDEVVLRTLEYKPEQRYQKARDVGTDVASIQATQPVVAEKRSPGERRLSEWVSRVFGGAPRPIWVALGIMVLAAVLSTVWQQFRIGQERAAFRERQAEWLKVEPEAQARRQVWEEVSSMQRHQKALTRFESNRFRWSGIIGAVTMATNEFRVAQLEARLGLKINEPLIVRTNLALAFPFEAGDEDRRLAREQLTRRVEDSLRMLTNSAPFRTDQAGLRIQTSGPDFSPNRASMRLTVTYPESVGEEPSLSLDLRDYSLDDTIADFSDGLRWPAEIQPRGDPVVQRQSVLGIIDPDDLIAPEKPFIPVHVEFDFPTRIRYSD